MWSRRIPFMGGNFISRIFTIDTIIDNMWAYLGNPTDTVFVTFIVDGADIGYPNITLDFAAGSTFTINCINGGRVLGLGGNGGKGGDDLGSDGTYGDGGVTGGAAITSNAFNVSVNIDDGFLLGGGGGGGGGAADDLGVTVDPGGGGGGGQGYGVTTGGAAGTGSPLAAAGTGGTQAARGVGGAGGTSAGDGGNGGVWGAGGRSGKSTDIAGTGGGFFLSPYLNLFGGVGGRGGRAFAPSGGAVISYSGAKNEATLRSEGRIKGETLANSINLIVIQSNSASDAGTTTHGWRFKSNGNLEKIQVANPVTYTDQWASVTETGFGANYQIRTGSRTGDIDGTWDVAAAAAGTWIDLSADRTWTFTHGGGLREVGQLFELRRIDLPAGVSDNEIMVSIMTVARDS